MENQIQRFIKAWIKIKWRLCPHMISHAVQFLLCPSLFWTSSESHCTETHFTISHITQRHHDLDKINSAPKFVKMLVMTVILKGESGLTGLSHKAKQRSKCFESKPKHSEENQQVTKMVFNVGILKWLIDYSSEQKNYSRPLNTIFNPFNTFVMLVFKPKNPLKSKRIPIKCVLIFLH